MGISEIIKKEVCAEDLGYNGMQCPIEVFDNGVNSYPVVSGENGLQLPTGVCIEQLKTS